MTSRAVITLSKGEGLFLVLIRVFIYPVLGKLASLLIDKIDRYNAIDQNN